MGRSLGTSSLARLAWGALVLGVILTFVPAVRASAASYRSAGWYSGLPSGQDYFDVCDTVTRYHPSSGTNLAYDGCGFFATSAPGEQAWGSSTSFYTTSTVKVAGSTGFVNDAGTIVRAYTASTDRQLAAGSTASYFGAVWNDPGSCGNRPQFRFVYASLAVYSTSTAVSCSP